MSAKGQNAHFTPSARTLASTCLHEIAHKGLSLDQATSSHLKRDGTLPNSTRRQALSLLRAALRSRGRLERCLNRYLAQPLKKFDPLTEALFYVGAADILCQKTPAYAVFSEIQIAATRLKRPRSKAVLRAVLGKIAAQDQNLWDDLDPAECDIPNWLLKKWQEFYGQECAEQIALASLTPAPLDIVTDRDASALATQLGGTCIAPQTVRLPVGTDPEALPGYEAGLWWVQDVSASLVAPIFGRDLTGQRIFDLCAAPGGKTAWLARAGADVTAIDMNPHRMKRLHTNLARLSAPATCLNIDLLNWEPEALADGVLLDAPCSGTGTLRRHPDGLLSGHKSAEKIKELAIYTQNLLEAALRMIKPGGRLVFSVCSLEPEEGEEQLKHLLERHPKLTVESIEDRLGSGFPDWAVQHDRISHEESAHEKPSGLRLLPSNGPPMGGGCDGFFVASLVLPT